MTLASRLEAQERCWERALSEASDRWPRALHAGKAEGWLATRYAELLELDDIDASDARIPVEAL